MIEVRGVIIDHDTTGHKARVVTRDSNGENYRTDDLPALSMVTYGLLKVYVAGLYEVDIKYVNIPNHVKTQLPIRID